VSRGPGRVERAVSAALRDEPITFDGLARTAKASRQVVGRAVNRLATRGEAQVWSIRMTVPARRTRNYQMQQYVRGASLPLVGDRAKEEARRVLRLSTAMNILGNRQVDMAELAALPRPPIGGPNDNIGGLGTPGWEFMRMHLLKRAEEVGDAAGALAELHSALTRPLPRVSLAWAAEQLGMLPEYEAWQASLQEVHARISVA
jgi:hypothetical protein